MGFKCGDALLIGARGRKLIGLDCIHRHQTDPRDFGKILEANYVLDGRIFQYLGCSLSLHIFYMKTVGH